MFFETYPKIKSRPSREVRGYNNNNNNKNNNKIIIIISPVRDTKTKIRVGALQPWLAVHLGDGKSKNKNPAFL